MLVTLLFYALPPYVILFLIARALFGKITARSILALSVGIPVVFALCFFGGLAVSFMYEPASYWHSIDLSGPMAFWDKALPDDSSILRYFLTTPYVAFFTAWWIALYIVFTHFTWAFAVFFSAGAYIVFNWLDALYSARKIRDPNFGFGTEVDEFHRLLKL